MPIPNPSKDEEKDAFIGRCMGMLSKDFTDDKQRAAVCFSKWREMHGGKKPENKQEKKQNGS